MENQDYDRALAAARRLAGDYLDGLRERPVGREVDPAALAARLDEPLPERGCEPAEALAEWWRRAEPGVVASPGPRFFGFVTGGATPAALAGDWLASALDQNASLWLCSPAAAETGPISATTARPGADESLRRPTPRRRRFFRRWAAQRRHGSASIAAG